MKTPSGLIIILHEGIETISDREVLSALPPEWLGLPREIQRIKPISIKQGDYNDVYWPRVFIEQKRQFDERIKPLLEEFADYQVLYFGKTTIGLAIHLGSLVGSFRKVRVFQPHHDKKDWSWSDADAGQPVLNGVPKETYQNASGEVTLRVSTSLKIDAQDTLGIAPKPLREIEIDAPDFRRTIWGGPEQIDPYAAAFRDTLDKIRQHLPETDRVHLFVATTIGVAFRLGQEVSPTVHPQIELYEYEGNSEDKYLPVFTLNSNINMEPFRIDDKERDDLSREFEGWKNDLQKEVENFQKRIREENPKLNWYKALSPDSTLGIYEEQQWCDLSRFDTCQLDFSLWEEKKSKTDLRFQLPFLKALKLKLKDSDLRKKAMRLAIIRQSFKRKAQPIRIERPQDLQGYPKILDDMDYQADVYAVLHEFEIARHPRSEEGKFLIQLLEILLETQLAEEMLSTNEVMEAARLSRLIKICFQIEWIKGGFGSPLESLGNQPLIQFRGAMKTDGKQPFFHLKSSKPEECGLALLHNNKVFIVDQSDAMENLLSGFRDRDSSPIRLVLRQLLVQYTVQNPSAN